ncbi:cytosolic endo-beta-N-acetylglucosaminidase-like [Panonychus citri]|uniref:cytosolic endo-beta-N-acetylglucosaminidase-like n=1 Tax=Panonychus citri TaxID=50023 RepID=UPI0023082D9F|nr:cytosolic endo-beta-N-acetylglucosaminidase-like [Panonychus citri]
MSATRECFPINDLEGLITWNSDDCGIDANLISDLKNHHFFDGPKVILCHDMKGGYLEDRFIDGDDNYQAYRFFHWFLIDTFIYFSHHLITIPPLTWINAAHTNGVSILGTIITESKRGSEICDDLLESDEKIVLICQKLVDIALYFKFEGWFVNIENAISKTNVPKLLQFIETLKSFVKKAIPKGQVVWYDSVTINGVLDWQNCLNHKNVAFFQCCDAIFLNYTWTDHNLRDSSGFAASLGRLNDVFVGIDVFGRGMVGGGGFKTNVAVDKIRQHLLPIAIFAPGWVLEVLGPEKFTENQIKFWEKLSLNIRHLPKDIPFYTNFCQGFGLSKYKNGERISDSTWYNLSLVEPSTRNYVDGEIFLEDAYEGGQSIRLINWNEPLIKCYFSLRTGLEVQLIFKTIPKFPEFPIIQIKVQYQNPGSTDILLLHKEDFVSEETLSCLEPPIAYDNSSWNSVRFNVSPNSNAVLTSISIEKVDLTTESSFLLGALRVDHPTERKIVQKLSLLEIH